MSGDKPADRPGVRLWRRVRQPDAYGVVLAAVLLALIGTGFGGVVAALAALLQAAALLFALWTARYPPALLAVAVPVGLLAAGFALAGAVTQDRALTAVGEALTVLLVAGTVVLILGRIGRRPRVTLATIAAALSVYLLVGIAYAHAFGLINAVGGQFFTAPGTERNVDYLYFSLTTLTTTGYGDLVARTDPGRMTAVSEAVIGQLYLVTIVATVVSNVGRARRRDLRAGPDDR
ncbi:potassium channel family protein [Actinocatenispora rupis]|uniref:Potassium channel domain-containing protein n=1 Tax=Actinocatenispora rupis TaxID=519421 RepID=A0A8J3J3S8_9ACTN|nr:potassium channel family protein [Actinocatenispora rupis]GID09627.1 hypothetical protein Aru02nite_05160 [Actinocatenispora rupis]